MSVAEFRFHPTAFTPGRAFEQVDGPCQVCGRATRWRYTGPFYARRTAHPCPECIAEGRVATYVGDANFTFHDTDLREIHPQWREELLRRTPGFATFNPFSWPAKDGVPLAFVGYGDDVELLRNDRVRAAMNEAFEDELDGPSPYGLVFSDLEGAHFRVVVDLD